MTRRNTTHSTPILAVFLVLVMSLSGCTSILDVDEDGEYTFTPIDLGDLMMRTSGSPYLEIFSDCDELEIALKSSIEEEYRTSLLQAVDEVYYWGGGWLEVDTAEMVMDDGAATSSPPPKTRQEGVDFSGTNNQEQGVDEADFVKTNGYNIYFVDNGVLHIMDVPEFGEIEHASTTAIQGNPVAMMLDDDNLVVVSSVSSWNIDSDDPLEAGLEMFVSPPGKRLQSITLLSGGEQALTALSLIFAVFLVNPSPICVLDEVDAPLDDANVTRFCALLDELTKITNTRFIIITHHALTMSRMHRLYGITMPEKGISQLVAVDLEKAEELVA